MNTGTKERVFPMKGSLPQSRGVFLAYARISNIPHCIICILNRQ